MTTPQLVIAAYRPHPGRAADLEALLAEHVPTLRRLGLVTPRPPIVMRSLRGAELLEVFEWADAEAAGRAHEAPEVQALWGRMGEVAAFLPLADLAEAADRFPHFAPVALPRTGAPDALA